MHVELKTVPLSPTMTFNVCYTFCFACECDIFLYIITPFRKIQLSQEMPILSKITLTAYVITMNTKYK